MDPNIDLLLDIDLNATGAQQELTLADLEAIDWSAAVSSMLGILDPIGQLRDWLAGILSDFFDTIKKAFESLVKPVSDTVSTILNIVAGIPDTLAKLSDLLKGVVVDPILKALDWVQKTFPALMDIATKFIQQVADAIANLPNVVSNFAATVAGLFSNLADKIKAGFSWFVDQVTKLPDLVKYLAESIANVFGDLADRIKAGFTGILEQLGKFPDLFRDLATKISGIFADLADRIKSGLSWFIEQIGKLPDLVRDLATKISSFFADLADKIRAGFSWFIEQIGKLPDLVKAMMDRVVGLFSDLTDRIKAGFAWFLDQLGKVPDLVKSFAAKIADAFADLASKIREGFTWLIEQLTKAPDLIKTMIERITGDVTKGVGGIVEWVKKGFEALASTISEWFKGSREWFEAATTVLKQVGSSLMGSVNAVLQLPERLYELFKPLVDFFERLGSRLGSVLTEYVKDPIGWHKKYILEPVWNALVFMGQNVYEGLKKLGELAWSGLSWIWDKITGFFGWVSDRAVDLGKSVFQTMFKISSSISRWLWELVSPWFKSASPMAFIAMSSRAPDAENVIQHTLKTTMGVGETLWSLGGMLLPLYWEMTLMPLALRGLVRTVGDVDIIIEPAAVGSKVGGTKWNIKLSELADALTKGFEMFAGGYAMGTSMAIANMFTVNLQHLYVPRVVAYYDPKLRDLLGDILKEEFEKGADINMFISPVSETMLIDYTRRMLALSEGTKDRKLLDKYLATVRAHLKIYGLPKWYVDYLTAEPEQLAVKFEDRFGAERQIYLSRIFELPTHSEMARMTQRDIFPGVDVMQRVAWVRGWNEDLTTLMYLLTFKYPSFEKLWAFYMRALSGMLWFKAPDTIATVFSKEAETVKAGKPVSPLDLQKAIAGPDQLKAFETALNAYFKWLEYSNFSWFTDQTEMYGIPIGREITSKLGGWTADSWLLVDVAADIPGKIDMRWMSRFGIFQLMADRLTQLGVSFESYAPLVVTVPKLMDANPATQVQVDLTWFSKLLQATGLHPAWVPITTVAENIMVISDEMTLLRTGWLNLFKEGLITADIAENYLAGMITASYRVGYWDPDKKTWTSGWINLPVRWLPHERRLLELRMSIDRVMDLYREYYGYLKSGVRTLAITESDALNRLKSFVLKLNEHYKALTKQITGTEMTLRQDEPYLKLWIQMIGELRDIEAVERARMWWSRVSGWLLYRISSGYVKPEDIDNIVEGVGKAIPLHKIEVEAYKTIAKSVLGLVSRELVPTPSTLATLAEYVTIPAELMKKSFDTHRIPDEWRPIWEWYIAVRPLADDVRTLISAYYRAIRYASLYKQEIPKEVKDQAEKILKDFGVTEAEKAIRDLAVYLQIMVDEWREAAKEYIPTPSMLATMAEYMPEVRQYAAETLAARNVRGVWYELWMKYIQLRPVADNVRSWANAMFDLAEYAIISVKQLEPAFKILATYGWEELEIKITERTILAVAARRAFTWLIGTPRNLAAITRYTDKAADMAWTRISTLVDLLPIDDATKNLIRQMWKEYITVYQAYPEINGYITELVSAYGEGVVDDAGLEQELQTLRKLGVPELRLQLAKRRAYLRRARRIAR